MRIGVLTGGGDCPGLNAVIRAITRSGIGRGHEIFGFKDGFKGLIENRYIVLNHESVSGILSRGGTILGTTNRDNPFKFKQIVDGKEVYLDMSGTMNENYHALKLDCLVVIGGDGSMRLANQISASTDIKVIGVPKTIDNDIVGTEMTFGFNSAVDIATDALDRLHTTAESHHRVMILEVMGRDAGWIALHGGAAGGADIILIPEIPYNLESINKTIQERIARGKSFSLIIVSEGIKTLSGEQIVREGIGMDIFNVPRLGGVSSWLARVIEEYTGIESRATILGHLQRGGSPNSFDRVFATQLGARAAELAAKGRFGEMVVLRENKITSIPLEQVKGVRLVPIDDPLVKTCREIGLSFGD
ncbi:6-phosphofructokinase [Desulfitibacter alkalitolerans]|uniref:6-phosphofructokinase n=1 Tax=Desulfitibacter alkalitolerans TaxID=264641 RepID=UPI0004812FBB|nr:ATP-dependent 6-phosphofructokinase [Desulfitibacter alkalitolerans]